MARLIEKRPLVSIVITNYNYERYLEGAIRSAVDQTYPNVEVLVLDNCSTDGSRDVMAKFAGDPRVRLIYNETNIGRNANYNKGVSEARGELVAVLSADDYYVPHAIEELVACLERHPECEFVYANIFECNGEGEILGVAWLPGNVPVREYAGRNELRGLASHYSYMWLPTCLFKVDTIRRFGAFDATFDVGSDLDLNLRMAAAGIKNAFLNAPLACVRFHGANASWGSYQSSGQQLRELAHMLDRSLSSPSALAALAGAERGPIRSLDRHASRQDVPGVASASQELVPLVHALDARLQQSKAQHRSMSLADAVVSIVVTVRGGLKLAALHSTLASIKAQQDARIETLLVYHDVSDLISSARHLREFDGVRLFEYTGTEGEAGMRAAGLELSNGSVVIFANDSVRFEPSHVRAMLRALDSNRGANIALTSIAIELDAPYEHFSNVRRTLRRFVLDASGNGLANAIAVYPCIPLEAFAFRREAFDDVNPLYTELGNLSPWLTAIAQTRAGMARTDAITATLSYVLGFDGSPFGWALASLARRAPEIYARISGAAGTPLAQQQSGFLARLEGYAKALEARPSDVMLNAEALQALYGGLLAEASGQPHDGSLHEV